MRKYTKHELLSNIKRDENLLKYENKKERPDIHKITFLETCIECWKLDLHTQRRMEA